MSITKQDIITFYTKEGQRGDHQKNMYLRPTSPPHSVKRFKAVCALLDKYLPGKRFLELGCAEGLYCAYIYNKASLTVGADISSPKIERCPKRVPKTLFLTADWDNLPFAKNDFDYCLLSECVEHSLDPAKLIQGVMAISKRLIVTLPLEHKLLDKPLGEKGNGHLHLFSLDKVHELFRKYKMIEEFNDPFYYYGIYENTLDSRL